jgi:calcineurin-like phosphoesterase family protein
MRKNFHTETDKLWFTSDLHFGHPAMLKHCHRPFADVDEMDRVLINNWNANVQPRDHIFVLGDFSFRPNATTIGILGELQGIKYLIRGNHDNRLSSAALSMFDGVADYHEIDVDSQRIILCHFAFRSWNRMHYGSWNLHGHSHGNLPRFGRQLDVGVDAIGLGGIAPPSDYRPVEFAEVQDWMADVQIESHDHHQPKQTCNCMSLGDHNDNVTSGACRGVFLTTTNQPRSLNESSSVH